MVFISKHWFGICIFLLIALSFFLRFYNYEKRWGLAYDQAHDALVARYALESHKIPLVGPFSSAGPFQTGGEWYWFIMAGTAIYPNAVITPWAILTLLCVFFVYLVILVGKDLVNKKFGILVGFLSAISTAQIAQSTNLTNQTPLAVIALLAIFAMVKYVRTEELKYLFFLGFFVSLGGTIHLQGATLLFFLTATLIFAGKPSVKSIIVLLMGITIPLIPLLIFDIQNNFVNSRSMLQYYLYDQYKISLDVLGRRWLTYAGVFWPSAWSHVIGGYKIIGYALTIALPITVLYAFFTSRISKEWRILLTGFFLSVIVLRYIRTPLFDSYVVFLHPFILFFTGWIIYALYKRNILFGVVFIAVISFGSIQGDINEIKNATNNLSVRVSQWKETLTQKFPGKKFAFYDYDYRSTGFSLPLVLFLQTDNKLSDSGYRIGFGDPPKKQKPFYKEIKENKVGFYIADINSSSSAKIIKAGWIFVSPSAIYKSTEEWHK